MSDYSLSVEDSNLSLSLDDNENDINCIDNNLIKNSSNVLKPLESVENNEILKDRKLRKDKIICSLDGIELNYKKCNIDTISQSNEDIKNSVITDMPISNILHNKTNNEYNIIKNNEKIQSTIHNAIVNKNDSLINNTHVSYKSNTSSKQKNKYNSNNGDEGNISEEYSESSTENLDNLKLDLSEEDNYSSDEINTCNIRNNANNIDSKEEELDIKRNNDDSDKEIRNKEYENESNSYDHLETVEELEEINNQVIDEFFKQTNEYCEKTKEETDIKLKNSASIIVSY